MPVYLELFHGRRSPTEELDDWGSQGPILGPLAYVHTTYATDVKIETCNGVDGVFRIENDVLFYDGMYYGDWSVFGEEVILRESRSIGRIKQFDPAKASSGSPEPQIIPFPPRVSEGVELAN